MGGGVTPQQLLGELQAETRMIVCDLEAGIGAVIHKGQADLVLVVTEPSAKSIGVARRVAAKVAIGGKDRNGAARVIVVANRVRDKADEEAIRAALGDHEIVVVPEDAAIVRADRAGRAPIDTDPEAPAVQALLGLAERLARQPVAA